MKRVLLTGASGTVGREVLKQLCELPEYFEITVFDRRSKDSISFFKKFVDRIILIYGDLSNKSDICQACSDQDVVIHLAAVIPPLADKDPHLAQMVNITGTRNLIECIEELSPKAFFLYSSSISVYGDRNKDPWISTTDPLNPSDRDVYALTKIEAEKLVMNSRLSWSIFRLTAIMGTNNHKPSALMFHMPLDTPMEIATPCDTGRAFVKALDHPDVLNRNIYNLSGGEKCRITYSDFLSRSFEIFGLGSFDFQKNTFAGKNFHCGYYKDGDLLNEILNFRQDSIEDYFITLKKSIPPVRKIATTIFRKIIKHNLEKQSEPLIAMKSDDKADIKHFF
jgi:nucleoside-diphosphate-sugar epimerase